MVATSSKPLTERDREPLVADWLKSGTAIRKRVSARVTWTLFVIAFHVGRSPSYYVRLVAKTPHGLKRALFEYARWVTDRNGAETVHISKEVVGRTRKSVGSINTAEARHDSRFKWRAGGTLLVGAVAYWKAGLVLDAGLFRQVIAGAFTVIPVGMLGHVTPFAFADMAESKRFSPPLTKDLVAHALENCGISDLARVFKEEGAAGRLDLWVKPLANGDGYQLDVDVPVVTAAMVIEKQDRFIRGLRRQADQVFLETDPSVHPGRLVCTILDRPLSDAPSHVFEIPAEVDIFEGIEAASAPSGRRIPLHLIFQTMLLAAAPGGGKSFTMRLLLLLCALDTRVRISILDFGGKGEYGQLKRVADMFRQGDDPDDIEAGMEFMEWLDVERRRRKKILGALPPQVCPDSKITPAIAADPELNMPVLVIGIDEFQELSEHEKHGPRFNEIGRNNVRQLRALGIILILSTQRPDSKAISSGIRDQLTLRILFRVMDHAVNDMVLGAGMHGRGFSATTFKPTDHGKGYLKTEGDPQICKFDFLDGLKAVEVVDEIVRRRTDAGVMPTGNAAGGASAAGTPVDGSVKRVIDHVIEVWPGDREFVPTEELAVLLAVRWPKYEGWRGGNVTRALKDNNLSSVSKKLDGVNYRCLSRAAVIAAT